MNVFPTLYDLLLIIHDYMIANKFFNSFFLGVDNMMLMIDAKSLQPWRAA